MMRNSGSGAAFLALSVLLAPCLLASGTGFAQDEWKVEARSALGYDSNPFRLSDRQIDRLLADLPVDAVNRRFSDMNSTDDSTLSVGLEAEGWVPGPFDGSLRLAPRAAYHHHFENTKKDFAELGLELRQPVGNEGRATLELGCTLDAFKRNYLVDATDYTGEVTASEEVYAPAAYDEGVVLLGYRHRLFKRRKEEEGRVRGLTGEVLVGGRWRRYGGPFRNRDQNGALLRLACRLDLGPVVDLEADYSFEKVYSPAGDEVLILDEPQFDFDFSGDGDTEDLDRRTVQTVDRSRDEHGLEVGVRITLPSQWRVRFRYGLVGQSYTSTARFDVAHRDREDLRHRVRLDVDWPVTSRWTVGVESEWRQEIVRRPVDLEADEDEGYREWKILLAASCRF
jgi:hypothetical protein